MLLQVLKPRDVITTHNIRFFSCLLHNSQYWDYRAHQVYTFTIKNYEQKEGNLMYCQVRTEKKSKWH
jgi:hypothetical protein